MNDHPWVFKNLNKNAELTKSLKKVDQIKYKFVDKQNKELKVIKFR